MNIWFSKDDAKFSRSINFYRVVMCTIIPITLGFITFMVINRIVNVNSYINENAQYGLGLAADVGIILAILTLVYGVFFYFYHSMIKGYLSIKKQLANCENILKDINTIKDFKDNYSEIGKAISNNNYIGNIWWEFCETLIIERQNPIADDVEIASFDIEDNPIISIENTAQTELYINKENIIEKQIRQDVLDAIPGILTGLGLVGTFTAITVALLGFNIDKIDTSVQNLLGGLSIKFISSLAGILTSILFLYVKSHLFSNLETTLSNLQNKLNKIFPRRTTESYLCSLIKEMKQGNKLQKEKLSDIYDEIEDQSNNLKQFLTNTDFSDAIKNAVSESISNAKPDLIDAINISLAKLDEIKNSSFSEMHNIKNELIGTLNNLNSSLSYSISESMNNSLGNLNNNFNGAISELTSAMNEFKNLKQESAAGLIDKMIEEIRNTMINMQSSFTDAIVGDSNNTINSLQDSLRESSQYMLSLKDTFNDFMQNMKNQMDEDNRARNESVSRAVNDTIQQVSNVNSNVQRCIDEQNIQLNEWLGAIKSYLDEIHHNESHVKENYHELLDKLNLSIQSQTDVLNNNENLIRNLANASNQIISASNNLQAISNNITDIVNKTKDISIELGESLDNSNDVANNLANTLNTNIDSLNNIHNSVTVVNNELGNAIEKFAMGSKQLQEEMFKSLAENVSSIMGSMSGVIGEQRDLIEDLNETIENIGNRR